MKVEAPEPIKKESASRKELNAEYRKFVSAMLIERPNCELKIKGICTKKAEGGHHIQKRNRKNMCDPANVLAACNSCNGWVETHPLEAIELGISKSKHFK